MMEIIIKDHNNRLSETMLILEKHKLLGADPISSLMTVKMLCQHLHYWYTVAGMGTVDLGMEIGKGNLEYSGIQLFQHLTGLSKLSSPLNPADRFTPVIDLLHSDSVDS